MRNTKLYNVFFPISLINIFPLTILIFLPITFLLNTIILLIELKFLKIINIRKIYKKAIFKIWIIGLISYFIGISIMMLTDYFGNIPFMYDNIILPISTNPFSNIYAVIYCSSIVILCLFIIYFLNKKISFINTGISEKNKKIISILLALLTAPYFFFVPNNLFIEDAYHSNLNKLEQYRDSYSSDQSAITNILNMLDSKVYMTNFKVESLAIVINYNDDVILTDVYKTMEEDAAILFSLVKDIEKVGYHFDEKDYHFNYDDINKIFDNKIKEYKLETIKGRYKEARFDSTYLGNINGIYDLFDESTLCSTELGAIYEDNNYKYLVSCSQIDYLYLIDNEDNKLLLKDAIKNNIITVSDLSNTILTVHKEKK